MIGRIPFEAPEIDTYDDSKHQLIDYGLKLLDLSQDSAVVSESSHQEAVMSIVCMSRVLEFFVPISALHHFRNFEVMIGLHLSSLAMRY